VTQLAPQVAEMWGKYSTDKENAKETKRMIATPFYANLVQLGFQVVINIGIVLLALKFFDK
jgi:hypothetical protein